MADMSTVIAFITGFIIILTLLIIIVTEMYLRKSKREREKKYWQ